MKGKLLYIFIVNAIAFLIWVIGVVIMLFEFPDATWTTYRIWAAIVILSASTWCCIHFYRKEKKEREDEENENYKGVY